MAVLWHHSPGLDGYLGTAGHRGFLGVDMFFVLSGFLISMLLIRERKKYGKISLKAFWVRRSLRIFPIYYLLLFALAVAYALKSGDLDAESFFSALPFNLFYLSNWIHDKGPSLSPLWSLATEEQFYLVWPLIEAFAGKRTRRVLLGIILLLNSMLAFRVGFELLPSEVADNLAAFEITQTTFLPIALGVVIAHATHNQNTFGIMRFIAGATSASLIWLFILLGLLISGPGNIQGLWRILIQIAMAVFIASCVINPKHYLSSILDFRLFRSVGEVSYGMYLYHMWIIAIFLRAAERIPHSEDIPALVFFVIVIASVYLVALISFCLMERPILKFKKRFQRLDVSRAEPILRDWI